MIFSGGLKFCLHVLTGKTLTCHAVEVIKIECEKRKKIIETVCFVFEVSFESFVEKIEIEMNLACTRKLRHLLERKDV
jgi:hypothetical protein